jgi:hypothetical protein
VKRAASGHNGRVRRLLTTLAAAVAVAVAGCAESTPTPDQVKNTARSWAERHLHPSSLEVTSVIVTRDEKRAKVKLTAGSAHYRLRLLRPGDEWIVVSSRRG